MRRFILGFAILAVSATWGTANATDQDTFNKLVAKAAPDINVLYANFKPKLACVCNNGSPGFVAQTGAVIACFGPSFQADGRLGGYGQCGLAAVLH